MLPEIGLFSLILALMFAVMQSIIPLVCEYTRQSALYPFITIFVIGQSLFLMISLFILWYCFLRYDFTVLYVYNNGNSALPFWYRLGAVWSGHEGSLLLWCYILSLWGVSVSMLGKILPFKTLSKILCVLGFLSVGFLIFLITTSNPFTRIFPDKPLLMQDLTPILQDPGLMFHPPMLYFGYVGFSVAFAFAITALWEKKMERCWITLFRKFVVLSWCFLTAGITLGSWWAYRELGWGGWWFWDPVENASFMPWLAGAVLIHALIINEKRGVLKHWTLMLAIISFALTLLGTFIVRSGVLISVHAFTTDPTRGLFLLFYFMVVCLVGFGFYIKNSQYFVTHYDFALFSREGILLLNNIVILTALATIVIGTIYPVIIETLGLGKLSVGEPYFNTVFVPLVLPLLLLMAFAPYCAWQKETFSSFMKKIFLPFISSFIITLLITFKLHPWHWMLFVSLFISISILVVTCLKTFTYIKLNNRLSLRYTAMVIGHAGIAITLIGISINRYTLEQTMLSMKPRDSVNFAGYHITFLKPSHKENNQFQEDGAIFTITDSNHHTYRLSTEVREFYVNHMMITKTGILAFLTGDVYIALGQPLKAGYWTVRIYHEPFVRWIWFGGICIVISGLLVLLSQVSIWHFQDLLQKNDGDIPKILQNAKFMLPSFPRLKAFFNSK